MTPPPAPHSQAEYHLRDDMLEVIQNTLAPIFMQYERNNNKTIEFILHVMFTTPGRVGEIENVFTLASIDDKAMRRLLIQLALKTADEESAHMIVTGKKDAEG